MTCVTGSELSCWTILTASTSLRSRLRGIHPFAHPPEAKALRDVPARRAYRMFSGPFDGSLDTNGAIRQCPPDTVPMLRQSVDKILAAGGLDKVLAAHVKRSAPTELSGAAPPAVAGYKYALGVNTPLPGGANSFDSAFSVYSPNLDAALSDHSIAQTWAISSGSTFSCAAPNCLQSLEAGWNVDFSLYGDTSTHFFTYSTKDGYVATGCYNLATSCFFGGQPYAGSGFFVVAGAPYTPGMTIAASTAGDANPQTISLGWELGYDANGNPDAWWLFANFSQAIGYIPVNLFNNGMGGSRPLTTSIATGQAGGEVYDSGSGTTDSTTDMGSGRFGATGFGQAAFHRNVTYGIGGSYANVTRNASATNSALYSASLTAAAPAGSTWGSYFYYGGPGMTLPSTPGGVTASAANGRITVRWNAATNATFYRVRRSTTSGGPYTEIAGSVATTSYVDSAVTRGRRYYYVVLAANALGNSANSAQVSAVP